MDLPPPTLWSGTSASTAHALRLVLLAAPRVGRHHHLIPTLGALTPEAGPSMTQTSQRVHTTLNRWVGILNCRQTIKLATFEEKMVHALCCLLHPAPTSCFRNQFQNNCFRVQGTGLRVQGSGCRVQGSGCRVQGSGCRVQGSGLRLQGSGFKVQGSESQA